MKDRAISLNAVIDALDQSINIFEAEDRIRDLPSVKPQEPKTGRWIHTDECDEEWQYRCSECNMPSKSNSHRYCSNCGSYMYGMFEPQESEVNNG